VQNKLGLTGIGPFDPSLDLISTVGSGSGGCGAAGAAGRRRYSAAAGAGGSSEFCVNATLAMDSTRVWPGRKRARRGMRLRG
jgi:hypothetical protein